MQAKLHLLFTFVCSLHKLFWDLRQKKSRLPFGKRDSIRNLGINETARSPLKKKNEFNQCAASN